MKVSTILDQIDIGSIALPEFQRGYVWNRDQVRGLMDSLYRKHPVGTLLVWVTKTENANARGDNKLQPGSVKLLLDGQQRMTSLYGIIRGRPPAFFDGNAQTFTGLYFHLKQQRFEFYAPLRMRDDSFWINVTELMQKGVGEFIAKLVANPELQPNIGKYLNRLNAIDSIKDVDLHMEEVTGEDKTVDVVVDIFNNVNSGGTKLSKGDLALAKICAEWPDARQEMKTRLVKWKNAGFNFRLEWFLRCINSVLTGEALFDALENVNTEAFRQGLEQTEGHIGRLLDLISGRIGLDHDRVLGSRYSFPLLVRYMHQRGENLSDHHERDKLLYWYIHTFLWGRYAGSTESVLNQDLDAIEQIDGGLDRLIQMLRRSRGDLRLHSSDFEGWSKGARFYPMLYMLTRVHHAKDWDTGVDLSNFMLGRLSSLQVHHIFPKSLLYEHGYSRSDVNAIANFTFLTQETNLKVSNRDPAEYMEEFQTRQPGVLESHWVPMNPELWKVENYLEFLAARRELLAQAANDFLDGLLSGSVSERQLHSIGGVDSEEEDKILLETNIWVTEQGLPEGEFGYELTDETTGDALAVIDLAWPEGLQEGYSQPVALLIDEDSEIETIVNRHGYLFFTDAETFKEYVLEKVLAVQEAAD